VHWTIYDTLLDFIDERIKTSEPRRADYFRGYRRGVHFYIHGSLEEAAKELEVLYNGSGNNIPYRDAFGRGYLDGCRGLKPEDN
jgi:hypothetical protein